MNALTVDQDTESSPRAFSESESKYAQRPDIIRKMAGQRYSTGSSNTDVLGKDVGGTDQNLVKYSFVPLQLPKFNVRQRNIRDAFVALHEWEGHVVEIGAETFRANINSITDKEDTETVEFLLDDVSEDDLGLLKPDAIFRWAIGYKREHGTKSRLSRIVFRRLPQWLESDLTSSRVRAKSLAAAIPSE